MRNAFRWRVLLPGALALLTLSGATAQARAQVGSVLLQVKPGAGDTIRIRLDQTVEMTGPPGSDGKAVVESGTLVMLATLAVEAVDAEGATIVSVTSGCFFRSAVPTAHKMSPPFTLVKLPT